MSGKYARFGKFDLIGILGAVMQLTLFGVLVRWRRLSEVAAKIAGRSFLLFDVGGAVALVGMEVMAVAAAARHTAALYRQETLQ